jgi:hypothetical protein
MTTLATLAITLLVFAVFLTLLGRAYDQTAPRPACTLAAMNADGSNDCYRITP